MTARKLLPDGRSTGPRFDSSIVEQGELHPRIQNKPAKLRSSVFDDTGKPLWLWLREMRTYKGSPIENLLAGKECLRNDWPVAKSNMAAELLYRVVRRWPKTILAGDHEAIGRIANRYHGFNNSFNQYLPDAGIGFLEALPDREYFVRKIGATGGQGSGELDPAIRDACLHRRKVLSKPAIVKRMARMSKVEKTAFILLTETEGLINGKTWIRRQKNRSPKGSPGACIAVGGVDERSNQQRSGFGECASSSQCGDADG